MTRCIHSFIITVSIIIILTTSSYNKPVKDNISNLHTEEIITDLKKCDKILEKTRKIYSQELQRWTIIHNCPSSDEIKVNYDNKTSKIKVNIKIDNKIKNEINSQDIVREYEIGFIPPFKTIMNSVDLVTGATYMISSGLRPFLTAGFRPKMFNLQSRIGIGITTTIYDIGASIYGLAYRNISISLIYGTSVLKKNTAVGIGFGVLF